MDKQIAANMAKFNLDEGDAIELSQYTLFVESLPDPTAGGEEEDEVLPVTVSTQSQCHGCGMQFEQSDLKRCTACKRSWYCSKSCQVEDYRKRPSKAGNHKNCCKPDLLSLAMDNIRRISLDKKLLYNQTGKNNLIPNHHFSQTVSKMSCPSVDEFLKCVQREYPLVRDQLIWNKNGDEAAMYPGNCQEDMIEGKRYGLDIGVEALCAAINMWPGVYTVNSCSGLHAGAWVQIPPPGGDGRYWCFDLVQFVSDDISTLNHIQAIIEQQGGYGIHYDVCYVDRMCDSIGGKDGFLVIDCDLSVKGTNLPTKCRTYGRAMRMKEVPFDKLDCFFHSMSLNMTRPPHWRAQYNILGFLGVAFRLVCANPSLELTKDDIQKLNETEKPIQMFRKLMIEMYCERAMHSTSASGIREIYAGLHQRIKESIGLLDRVRQDQNRYKQK